MPLLFPSSRLGRAQDGLGCPLGALTIASGCRLAVPELKCGGGLAPLTMNFRHTLASIWLETEGHRGSPVNISEQAGVADRGHLGTVRIIILCRQDKAQACLGDTEASLLRYSFSRFSQTH